MLPLCFLYASMLCSMLCSCSFAHALLSLSAYDFRFFNGSARLSCTGRSPTYFPFISLNAFK